MYDPAAFERPACGADREQRLRAVAPARYNWKSEAIIVEILSLTAIRRPASRHGCGWERVDVAA